MPRALPLRAVAIVTIGVAAGLLAIALGEAPKKVLIPVVVMCLLIPILLRLDSDRQLPILIAALLGVSVPIHLRVNLFVENHVGGAPSITVTPTVLLVLLFWAVWLRRRLAGTIQNLVDVHWPTLLALAALLALVLPSFVNAQYQKLFVLEWIRLVILGLGLVAMMSLREVRLVRAFMFGLSVQVILQASIAIAQYSLKRTLGLGILGEEQLVAQNIGILQAFRATGTMGHPNTLAYFFEMALPVMLGLALARQPARVRVWYALAFFCGLAGVFVTLTRGAWLTLPVSCTLVLVMVYGRRIVRVKAALASIILLCVTLAIATYAWPIIEKRFTHTDYKSSGSRMPLNLAAISIIEKHPLVGIGLNNFAERFKAEDTTGYSRIFKDYRQLVHNQYLWIATEVGLLGLAGYLGVFFTAIFTAWRAAKRAPPVPRALLLGMAAGLLAHLQHGFFDPGFRVSLSNSFQIFFYFGVIGMLARTYAPKPMRPFRQSTLLSSK